MANIGKYRDHNKDMRAAGVPSAIDLENTVTKCLKVAHIEELAEHLMSSECKRQRMDNIVYLPQSPFLPDVSVPELMAIEQSKTRFAAFKEKFSEEMYLKKAKLGEVKPTGSKPDHITNLSCTFGRETTPHDHLYDLILPRKPAKQVSREYGEFHDKYVLSHNHYFPAEQVNRRYNPPFSRDATYGSVCANTSGQLVKRCMEQCAGHVIIISKEQMDFIDRTYPRLGKKLKKYPYTMPANMTYGTPSAESECDVKMLMECITPCTSNKHLVDALGFLNMLRHKLHKRADFHMFDLISVLEHADKAKTRHLPLKMIFEVMHKMHLYIDIDKMRTVLSHFKMILDEQCPTERVNYDDYCHLLNIQNPLPTTGNISTMPANVFNKDTTYRLLCADLSKEPVQARPVRPLCPTLMDEKNTHVKDLLSPNIATLYGLMPSDYKILRPKQQLMKIFKNIVSEAEFEAIWQQLMDTYKDQNSLVSVLQFREVMDNTEPATPQFNA